MTANAASGRGREGWSEGADGRMEGWRRRRRRRLPVGSAARVERLGPRALMGRSSGKRRGRHSSRRRIEEEKDEEEEEEEAHRVQLGRSVGPGNCGDGGGAPWKRRRRSID